MLATGADAALEELLAAVRSRTAPASLRPWRRSAGTVADLARTLASERGDDASADMLFWVEAAQRSLESRQRDIDQTVEARASLERRLQTIAATARAMANAMEFDFLLDEDRRLLSIGYLATEDRLDPSCYDLLASEARLASFVAIATGDVPARHWFRLGRAVTPVGRGAALISWSGSMFEYLMPSLVMRAPLGSLIEKTNDLIVRRQIEYAVGLGLPWGVSESAYNARDKELTYQYSNFGVPGLGFKRGLERERRRGALCHGARRHGRSRGGDGELRPPGRDRRSRPLRLLRGDRLHAGAAARRQDAWPSCAPTWPITRA